MHNLQLLNDYPVRLLSITLLRHANFYSGDSVVKMQVDLQSYDEVFTNQIPGFYEKLKNLIPSLYEHHCSEGVPGGFFIRVKDGTLLGHVIEHVAIELQHLAGMNVGFGKTRQSTRKGIYNVVFRYVEPHAAILAGKAAVHCINALLTDSECDIMDIVQNLVHLREMYMPLPTVQLITSEARKRHIPVFLFEHQQYYVLGTGKYMKKLFKTCTPATTAVAAAIADDRLLTYSLLQKHHLPTPPFLPVKSLAQLQQIIIDENRPLIARSRFRNIEHNILFISPGKTDTEYFDNFKNQQWLVHPYQPARILQFLVIDKLCAGVVQVIPPQITGDGKKTVLELIRDLNADAKRKTSKYSELSIVPVDTETRMLLDALGLTYESIPEKGQTVLLKIHAQQHTGSYIKQITDKVDENLKQLAVQAAQIVGLDVALVEMYCFDSYDATEHQNLYITEINSAPEFTMFHHPSSGEPLNVAQLFLNYLFKHTTHIPLISITGSAGKTTCANIIFHYFQHFRKNIGGIFKNKLFLNNVSTEIDEVNPETIRKLLLCQDIDMAVLEMPVETIIHSGLGYPFADFGIVLNVQRKHIEELDLHDEEDLAYAKSVVAEEVHPEGWTILNADDPLVREMSSRTISRIAWFTKRKPDSSHRNYAHVSGNSIELKLEGCATEIIRIENRALLDDRNELFDSAAAAVMLLYLMGQHVRDVENFLNNHFEKYC